MKEEEFRQWLQAGGALTESGRNTRVHGVKTIGRKLAALGSSCADLDEAWAQDQFAHLRERLRRMREDARNGGQDYRILMPDSEKPLNRLSNWNSWLAQYGRFLAGEQPGTAKDADRIRQYVLERYIEPARDEGRDHVEVLVRDVNQALDLNQGWPNICQALAGQKFRELAEVPAPERIGADQSPATVFRFNLSGAIVDRAALERLRERFVATCPDFRTFREPGAGWARDEKAYKVVAAKRVREAIAPESDETALGKTVFEILKTAAKNGPFVRWQTEDNIARSKPELLPSFYRTIGKIVRSGDPPGNVLREGFTAFSDLREQGATALTFGERINILFSALAMVRPMEAAPLKITVANDAWRLLTGASLFVENTAAIESDYRRFAEVFGAIFAIMRDEWGWEPQDWLDVQGFLWIALKGDPDPASAGRSTKSDDPERPAKDPVNLILYGPPGTGKTYATAAEAVRLCGEEVPTDRGELTSIYNRLCDAKRIEFVTFHQSMSYEDFIEGRQPQTGGEGENPASAGFRLETVPGVFRCISRRAEARRGQATPTDAPSTEPESFVLIIDEINRANISKVFGELITLLEPDKRLGGPNQLRVRLPYSGDEFGVPANLHIVATMNTADRSIALLDTALRRRFEFRELMPDPSVLEEAAERTSIDLPHLLTTINERIEYLFDREHQIGHAYFVNCDSLAAVDAVMRHKVIPLLAEYFFEDWSKVAAVLGDAATHEGEIKGGFLNRTVLKMPPGLDSDGETAARFRWSVRSEEDGFDYSKLLGT